MRIGVMGAGAVGSYFGAKLARSGEPVVLLGRGAHIAAVAATGLAVDSVEGSFRVLLQVAANAAEAGPCDLVLVCVKSRDTAAAAAAMAPLVGTDSVVVSLQNGIENEAVLEQHYPGQVVPGLCYVGACIDQPGTVVHSAAGRIIIGERDGARSPRVSAVAEAFTRAGVPVTVSDAIAVDSWKKLLWNLAFNTVSALARASVAQMLEDPAGRRVLEAAMAEAVAVAQAAGVPLADDLPARVIESSAGFGALKTSMLQDVEKHRPLEADALNGAVVRLGEHLGVPTPCNRTLLDCALLLSTTNVGS